jgi:hypothetical protein
MITKPTVFVLGAGVSMPYGFPSGKKLVELIHSSTREFAPEYPTLSSINRETTYRELVAKFGKDVVMKFGDALFYSQQQSIDAFLEHRPEFSEIGKLAISLLILSKEIEYELLKFENRDKGCYQFLFSKLTANWDEFSRNKVGFVTFNYDRSLEHFLFTSLKNTYNKTDSECAQQFTNIPIIHVHGLLGKLPWQSENGIPYGCQVENPSQKGNFSFDINLTVPAAKQIAVISEDQFTSKEFESAFQLLSKADQIYFLGFSYHPTNMKRLQLEYLSKLNQLRKTYSDESVWVKHSHLQGTALGMEDAEIHSVQNKWHVRLPERHCDSLQFLRRFAILD